MKKSLKIVFFGNEKIATGIESSPLIFDALLKSEHCVVGLVVHASQQQGRNKKHEPIIASAEAEGIPVFNPSRLIEIKETLQNLNADIGVLVAYGKIVPSEIIDLFPYGILNLHPSLLPKLRGSTPIETAILEGLPETGVSIMCLAPEMDAGDIVTQVTVKLNGREHKKDLATQLHILGKNMLIEKLGDIDMALNNSSPQDHSLASFCTRIKKSDGQLDFTKPAYRLEREIRAYHNWPGSWFIHDGKKYDALNAWVDSSKQTVAGMAVVEKQSLGIGTTEGVLVITSIKPEGKKEMCTADFLNGYRKYFSEDL